MRVLIDITHPVNVHFFKHLIARLKREGHDVLVTARDKDVTVDLLGGLGIDHRVISRQRSGVAGMAGELIARNGRLLSLARRFAPDVMVASEAGVSIGPAGTILGVPRVVFDQVDLAPLQRAIGLPLASVICTSDSYLKDHGRRHVRFRGAFAQAYLDPRRHRPNPAPLRRAGIDPDEPYVVLRLVRWSATHDVGRSGMNEAELRRAIDRLGRCGRVLVSSEQPLSGSLKEFESPVCPLHLHDLLGLATLVVGEGGTVAVEAGVQGTPAVCCSSYDFGYLRELDRRGVIRRTAGLDDALDLAEELLARPDLRQTWRRRQEELFEQTDDVLEVMWQTVVQAARRCRMR